MGQLVTDRLDYTMVGMWVGGVDSYHKINQIIRFQVFSFFLGLYQESI